MFCELFIKSCTSCRWNTQVSLQNLANKTLQLMCDEAVCKMTALVTDQMHDMSSDIAFTHSVPLLIYSEQTLSVGRACLESIKRIDLL